MRVLNLNSMSDFAPLKKNLITRIDLVHYLEEVSRIEKVVYDKEGTLSEKTKDEVSAPLQEVIEGLDSGQKEAGKQIEILKEIQSYLEGFSKLRLTIAFSPAVDFLKEIKADLSQSIDSRFVIDLAVEPKIIGGAEVEYKGGFLDLSLQSQLASIFNKEL